MLWVRSAAVTTLLAGTLVGACGGRGSASGEVADEPQLDAADALDAEPGDATLDGSRDVDAGLDVVDATPEDAGPDCEAVCFRWLDVAPPVPDSDAAVEILSDVCNPTGAGPGRCPAGSTCSGREEGWRNAGVFVDRVTCVPDGTGPIRIAVDDETVPADAVGVSLSFRWNGEPWPYVGTEGGEITLLDAEGARAARLRSWERTPDDVAMALSPGTYRVSFSPPADPGSEAVVLTRAAELVVVAPGSTTVDVDGAAMRPGLVLDGAAVERVPDDWSALLLQHRTAEGYLRTTRIQRGASLPARWNVQGPAARVEAVAVGGSDRLPGGWLGRSELVALDGASDASPRRVDAVATTADYRGTVTVDGQPVGGVVALIDAANVLHEVQVNPATGAWTLFHYQGEGQGFWRDDASGSAIDGRTGLAAMRTGEANDRALASTVVRGALTSDGAALDAGASVLRFTYEDGAIARLRPESDGTYAGTVFAGSSDIAFAGDGRRAPAGATTLAETWRLSDAFDGFDVAGTPWTITLEAIGGWTLPGGATDPGGRLVLTRLDDDGRPVRLRNAAADVALVDATPIALAARPWGASVVVAPGTWAVSWVDPLGRGTVQLGTFVVDDAPRSNTLEVAQTTLEIELLIDGEPLRADGPGAAGTLELGGLRVPVAGDGPTSIAAFAGDYDLRYSCVGDDGCRGVGAVPLLVRLIDGLSVRP